MKAMAGAHILVVDDDRDTRELYRLVFELSEYRVSEAGTMAGALALVRATRPDVVLTDWRLGDGNAFALCDALHRHGRTRHIPIVAATGMSLGPGEVTRARAVGCVQVLTKPVDVDALVESVERARGAATARRLHAAAARIERFVARMRRDGACAEARDSECIASRMIAYESRQSHRDVALIVADDRGRYVAANEEASSLTGYNAQELTRLSVWDMTPMSSATQAQELWARFIQTGNQEGNYVFRRRDGAPVHAQYVAIANIAPGLHLSALSAVEARQETGDRR
jgi:PAS domain S-box-containing protein